MTDEPRSESKQDSAKVLLDFAYFIESEQTNHLANLLQRLAIIVAADAALIGLWGNLLILTVPRLEARGALLLLLGKLLYAPLIIFSISLLLSAVAMAYRSFISIDPNEIITSKFYNGAAETAMREIAASYRRDWESNQPKLRTRTRLLNASLIILLVGLGWILIVLPVALVFLERS